MKNIFSGMTGLFVFVISTMAFAQNEAKPEDKQGFKLSGEAAMEYSYFNNGASGMPNTSLFSHESYRIAEASLVGDYEHDQVVVRGLLAFRERETSLFPDPQTPVGGENSKTLSANLEQLEVYYKASEDLKLGFGRLLTTMGSESVLRKENNLYGYTIAFQSITPGYYEGLRAIYSPQEWLKVNFSTYNSMADNVYSDDYVATKTSELSVGGKYSSFEWFTGYIWGTDGVPAAGATPATEEFKSRYNFWGSYTFEDTLKVLLSYESKTNQVKDQEMFWADSRSLTLTWFSGKFSLSGRYELIKNARDIGYGTADALNSYALSARYGLSPNMSLIGEYRMDSANEAVFADKEGTPAKEKSANVATVATLFQF